MPNGSSHRAPLPQELWQHDAPNRIPFSPDAIELFKKETVRIPTDEHWGDLHAAYNRTFRSAVRAYLAKEKKADETEDDFARRMNEMEARALYKHITRVILNPPEGLKEEEAKDAKHAKEFFENASWYVRK